MRSTADTVGICLAFVDLGDAFHVLVGLGAGWAATFIMSVGMRIGYSGCLYPHFLPKSLKPLMTYSSQVILNRKQSSQAISSHRISPMAGARMYWPRMQ